MPSLVITLTSVTAMGKTNDPEILNGLFEGGNSSRRDRGTWV